MPNHVATIMRVEGGTPEDREQFLADIMAVPNNYHEEKEQAKYDLNRLLPCPEALHEVSSPVNVVSEEEYQKAVAERKAALESKGNHMFIMGLPLTKERSDALIAEYGANNWYDWMHQNWGTKWGIYDCTTDDGFEFHYDTAWSPATSFYENISERYPSLTFYHEYADEGGGFVGFERIRNGSIIENGDYEWGSPEGIEIRQRVGYYYEDEENDEEEGDDE